MATALGGTSMSIGLGTSSPIIGGGVGLNATGSMGNLTPSHTGIKYCGAGSEASVHSPASTTSSTPNSTITINTVNSGSIGKCPGSVNSNLNGNIANNSTNITNNNEGQGIFGSKCKRKINFSNLGMPGRTHQPATVARRNARERNRVKQVNNGFASLKQHIPLGHRSKKMSKVETLRCAVDYIKNLQGMLSFQHSLNSASPASSSMSTNSGDIILMDDDDEDEDEEEVLLQPQQQPHHQHHQHHQMNGVNNQRDAFALSSNSPSSSPTSSDFGAVVAHLPQHLAALHNHHPQFLGNNNANQLRHLSLSHHHMHATNSVSVSAALLVDNGSSGVTSGSNQLSPTSSDDPSSPSHASEASYVNNNQNLKGAGMYDYENYEPVSPEDEELLDAIAWWQQS